jgi:chromosomal replication initiator protein
LKNNNLLPRHFLYADTPFRYNTDAELDGISRHGLVVMQGLAGFARLVVLPEIQSALAAFREVACCLEGNHFDRLSNPIFVHGPPGVGKSTLVAALADEVIRRANELSICVVSANDFPLPWVEDGSERFQEACDCDLLLVEDLQHLPDRAVESLIQLVDARLPRHLPTIVTASASPTQVIHRGNRFPARLTNRFAAGLVVAIWALSFASRRSFLQELAHRQGVILPENVLDWLARSLKSCRQLENALYQICRVETQSGRPPTLDDLREQFQMSKDQADPLDRIVQYVGDHFRVEPRLLLSSHRHRQLMRPRQISMFLARKLTPLTLEQIGAFFAGRDHATVLHACRQVEKAIETDPQLMGSVWQIHAELA